VSWANSGITLDGCLFHVEQCFGEQGFARVIYLILGRLREYLTASSAVHFDGYLFDSKVQVVYLFEFTIVGCQVGLLLDLV
jgi:hypothetical protein